LQTWSWRPRRDLNPRLRRERTCEDLSIGQGRRLSDVTFGFRNKIQSSKQGGRQVKADWAKGVARLCKRSFVAVIRTSTFFSMSGKEPQERHQGLDGAAQTIWSATVALVVIVISLALLLNAWQERNKHTNVIHGGCRVTRVVGSDLSCQRNV
jgi:hypothetical protein